MIETLVSVEEYLTTDYNLDVDYKDGRIEERNAGEKSHGKLQRKIADLLERIPGVFSFIETRVQVSRDGYRVPDVCAYLDREPDEQVFTTAPFLCVEILSPQDRLIRMLAVVEDYLAMGVLHVWIMDPWEKKAYTAKDGGLVLALRGIVAGHIGLTLEETFSGL